MTLDVLKDEEGRLCALNRYGLPGKGGNEQLDRIVKLVHAQVGDSIVSLSVLDRDRQIILSATGIEQHALPRKDALADLTIADAVPLTMEDCATDPRTADRSLSIEGNTIGAYLGVPLVAEDGYVLGCLEIFSSRTRSFSQADLALAIDCAQLATSSLGTHRTERYDNLTGATTRHQFLSEVEREFDRSSRYERPAALVFLDIDGFSAINEAMGLETADQVLKSIANHAIATLRSTDIFGRIGGSEFAMLLPETLAYEATQCAERLRETIARLRFRQGDTVHAVTCSFGVAPLAPGIKSAHLWFAQADIAVYQAKQAGRNCVVLAPGVRGSEITSSASDPRTGMGRVH